jgi:hypothetical protein
VVMSQSFDAKVDALLMRRGSPSRDSLGTEV